MCTHQDRDWPHGDHLEEGRRWSEDEVQVRLEQWSSW